MRNGINVYLMENNIGVKYEKEKNMKNKVYIIDAKRTAIGKFLGSFYENDPKDICVQLIKNGFKEELIKDI